MLLSELSPDEQRSLTPVVSELSIREARGIVEAHRNNGAHVAHAGDTHRLVLDNYDLLQLYVTQCSREH